MKQWKTTKKYTQKELKKYLVQIPPTDIDIVEAIRKWYKNDLVISKVSISTITIVKLIKKKNLNSINRILFFYSSSQFGLDSYEMGKGQDNDLIVKLNRGKRVEENHSKQVILNLKYRNYTGWK